jgi:hypothetical protein
MGGCAGERHGIQAKAGAPSATMQELFWGAGRRAARTAKVPDPQRRKECTGTAFLRRLARGKGYSGGDTRRLLSMGGGEGGAGGDEEAEDEILRWI